MSGTRVVRLRPAPVAEAHLGTVSGGAFLRRHYTPDRDVLVRLNMISSLTGAAVGVDGTSDTLTGGADREILAIIRATSDVVVVGAGSVRAEGYIAPRRARLAVVTESGDLTGARFAGEPARAASAHPPVLVLCRAAVADRVRDRNAGLPVEVVPVEAPDALSPERILAALRSRGLRRVVVEGGPHLAAQFADAGAIDEYCLTVAPTITPAARPALPVDRDLPVEPVGHLVDGDGFSYLRLRPRGAPRDPGRAASR